MHHQHQHQHHPPPPFKRRRIDSPLGKPFRSPLRRAGAGAGDAPVAPRKPESSAVHTHSAAPLSKNGAASHQDTTIVPGNIDTLQRQYTALARQLTLLRQSLDTAQQALRIQTSTQRADLDTLTAKWRCVVRDMAEELFEEAKQRVSRQDIAKNADLTDKNDDDDDDDDDEDQDQDQDDTFFTLDKMLVQMNCDLDLVGYDKEEQRWIDYD